MRRHPRGKSGHLLVLYGLTVTVTALGYLGIFTALAPRAPAISPKALESDRLVPYTGHRVEQLRAQVLAAPTDAGLRVKLAIAYAGRAAVRAHQEYSAAFPNAFQYGEDPPGHYEVWRRGWYRRDPHRDLRRALSHARRALALQPSRPARLTALRLIAHTLRQQSRETAAIAPLREIVALERRDRMAWLHLCQIYRSLHDLARLRVAQRHLEALEPPEPVSSHLRPVGPVRSLSR